MDKIPISISLERQIPEFIREEYSGFVEFVKAYYAFLDERQQRNLEDIRSIENTLDDFIVKFKKELSVIFPTNTLQNERFILQHIKDFYKSRGSKESFKFLFRALFNKDAEIYYPSTQILRVSDGSWIQEKSVFVESTDELHALNGKIIHIETTKKVISVFCPKVVSYRQNVYEVFIDRSYVNDITIGDTVASQDNTISGLIIPCPATYKIVTGGSGFDIGAIYNLPSESGNGSLVKITKIDSIGAIKKLQIISFGLDYESTFYAKLSNKTRQAFSYYNPITSFTVGAGHPAGLYPTTSFVETDPTKIYTDGTDGYLELGYINIQNYFAYDTNYTPALNANEMVFYADSTYVGEIIGSFYTNDTNTSIIDETVAEIRIDLGPVAIYPGYYSKSNGFISDESFIQDGKYYQLFSYVIKVEQQIESYRDIIKSLLHPAGFELFAEYNVKNNYDISASPLNAFIRRQFTEQQYITDDDAANDVNKFLESFLSTPYHSDADDIKDVVKGVLDTQIPIESKYYDMEKGSANDPIENSLASGYHNVSADVKDIARGTPELPITDTSISNHNLSADVKDIVRGTPALPITDITVGNHAGSATDIKDVVRGTEVDNAGVIHNLSADVKDIVRGTPELPITDTSTSNHSVSADVKDIVRGTPAFPITDTSTSNHIVSADVKDIVRGTIVDDAGVIHNLSADVKDIVRGTPAFPITENSSSVDVPGQRDVAGAGYVNYFRDKLYLNNGGELYPFDLSILTGDAPGQRDVVGAGSVSYVRNKFYVNNGGELYPFDVGVPTYDDSAKQINKGSVGNPIENSTVTSAGGDWSWNGSTYVLNFPEIRIGVNYSRYPILLNFQANLTSGSITVNLSSGVTHALQSGMLLTTSSGVGSFGVDARVATIIDSTTFTVNVSHLVSGSVSFYFGGFTEFTDSNTVNHTNNNTIAIGTILDTIPNSDAFSKTTSYVRSAADTIDNSDAFSKTTSYIRPQADTINSTSSGILYVNAYNQNDTVDPNTSYSYEAEVYSVHDTRAIS
jgi:hypothetical protein